MKQAFAKNFAKFGRSFPIVFDVFASCLRFSDVLGPVRTCSDPFGCVWMRSEVSASVSTLSEIFEKFLEKFWNFSLTSSEFSESVWTRPNASRCIRMHPNASECIRTGPNRSEQVQKPRKTCEKVAKISRTFWKNSRSCCIQMHPNASERIRMHPNRSEQVQASPKTSKNLRKLWKNNEKTQSGGNYSESPLFLFGLYLECSPTGLLEAPRLDFGSILKGLGRLLQGFWENLEDQKS